MATSQSTADREVYGLSVEIRVLGPIEVVADGQPLRLGGPTQRAVLAVLISEIGQVVSVDYLVDAVWGEAPPTAVRNSIYSYISNLRSLLGTPIERTGSGYRLGGDPITRRCQPVPTVDRRGPPSPCHQPVTGGRDTAGRPFAVARPPVYADLIDVGGLRDEVRRLEDLRGLAVESRIDADLAVGRHRAVIGELEALTAEHPFNEGLRIRHMLALYRDGRQAEALRAFGQTREILVSELGIDPSPELQHMEERILLHDPTLLAAGDVRTEEIAFLFTDLEDSSALWEARPDQMRVALVQHDEIMTKAVSGSGGRVFKDTGAGILAAFGTVFDAATAASQAQRALDETDWGPIGSLLARMSVDVGEVDVRGGDYFGPPMNRGARLMSSAHGGQVVLSSAAHQRLEEHAGVQIKNLGEHRFKGLGALQQVFQLVVEGLASVFPRFAHRRGRA